MVIKIMGREEINRAKKNAVLKELHEIEDDLIEVIKSSLKNLFTEDKVIELRDYLDDMLINWKDKEDFLDDDD